jgi:phosphate transport system permease protein
VNGNAVPTERTERRGSVRDDSRMAERTRAMVRRRRAGASLTALTWCAAALAVLPLLAILTHLVIGGARALTPDFFTHVPMPAGVAGGGMANAIVGTLILIGIASLIGVPIGLGAGLFVAERSETRLAGSVRFVADVLSGLPSIVLGILVWQLVVRQSGRFSGLAGGIALGLLIVPLVTRATEEMVKLVPKELAESALALGFPRWRTSLAIVLRTAMPGIVTATLVAVSRAAGETAPLLFTAFGNAYWSLDVTRPMAALPLQIYAYALSPYEDWRTQAWAGALVLLVLITMMSLLARAVLRARFSLLHGARSRTLEADA